MLAQANLLKGDYNQSIGWLEKAYQASDEVDSVYENLMLLYAKAGNRGQLARLAQEYMDKFKNLNLVQYRKVAQYYFQVGMYDESENILEEKVIPKNPDDWNNYTYLASIYEQKKEYKKAVEYLNGILEEHQDWPVEIKQSIEDYIISLNAAKK
jgi:lipopolysaccharide biosynthesis regulator YciM